MRCGLIAVLACTLCSLAQAKPQAVIYSASTDPNDRLQTLSIVLWDTEWLERVSGKLPDDYHEPTLKELCQEQSPWFVSLVHTKGKAIAPGAYFAVTLGEVGVDDAPKAGSVPLPEHQALMGVAMPDGPVIASRGAAVLHTLDAHSAKVTVAAYLPYPPDAPQSKSFSYTSTFTARSCVDILQNDGKGSPVE